MTQITIRGLDPEVERKIRRMARESGKSLNRVIQDMIYNASGLNSKTIKPAADSLRALAGGWSEKDALEFLESIKSCEQIDAEMWS